MVSRDCDSLHDEQKKRKMNPTPWMIENGKREWTFLSSIISKPMCLVFYLHDKSCYQEHRWYDRLYTTKLIRQFHCISSNFLLQRTGRTGRQGWSRGSSGITRDTRKPRNNRNTRNTRNNRNNRLGSKTHYYYYLWQMEIKFVSCKPRKEIELCISTA